MITVSLMFRYADFITFLGGTEYELGWIVGIGMVGAVFMRALQGIGVDRYGAGNIWLISATVVIFSLLGHLGVTRIDSPWIYALRILYATSLAGAFGASIVYVSLRAPAERIGETIGGLGSSGFIGMALGPILADYLFTLPGDSRTRVDRMFLWATAAAILSWFATLAARLLEGRIARTGKQRRVPILWLLRRYHPGPILMVGIAMGLGIGIPFYFLRPFAERLGIEGIRTFFVIYAAVAFLARVFGRRLPDRWGVRRTVTMGMIFLSLHLLAFLVVRSEWMLVVPAMLGGFAHAFVFPAAMAAASTAFPYRYRGLATAWMLTMIDLGNVLGQPAVGTLLHVAHQLNVPAYPLMFVVITASMASVTAWYALRSGANRQPVAARSPVQANVPSGRGGNWTEKEEAKADEAAMAFPMPHDVDLSACPQMAKS